MCIIRCAIVQVKDISGSVTRTNLIFYEKHQRPGAQPVVTPLNQVKTSAEPLLIRLEVRDQEETCGFDTEFSLIIGAAQNSLY